MPPQTPRHGCAFPFRHGRKRTENSLSRSLPSAKWVSRLLTEDPQGGCSVTGDCDYRSRSPHLCTFAQAFSSAWSMLAPEGRLPATTKFTLSSPEREWPCPSAPHTVPGILPTWSDSSPSAVGLHDPQKVTSFPPASAAPL